MYEQAASNWAIGLYSLFDPTNFLPFLPNLWSKQAISSRYPNAVTTKVRKTDILVGYLILLWVLLYLMYKKCLNSLFRRMRFPLIQRNRIIKAMWNCGVCFGSICYMKLSAAQILNFAPHKQEITYLEMGIALYKSFYLYQAGIDILYHGSWLKGFANLLFASFVLNTYHQKWCTITTTFLIYKTIDVIIINVCRILLCSFQTVRRSVCKLLFLLHCLTWTYLYLYYVPQYMLWSEEVNYAKVEPGLWLWFVAECLDSVWLRLIKHVRATHWLEICLFPPPTQEAIELTGIHKRYKESLKKYNDRLAKKVELWQTLVCAMAIKKKIRKLRQAKSNTNVSTEDSEEAEVLQTHVKDQMTTN